MSFFSAKNKTLSGKVPDDILSQVVVMGQGKASSVPPATPPVLPRETAPAVEKKPDGEPLVPPLPSEKIAQSPETLWGKVKTSNAASSRQKVDKKEGVFHQNWLWWSLIGVILVLLGGGLFFLYQRMNPEEEVVPVGEPVAEVVAEPVLVSDSFTLDKPNYLSLNTETATLESFQAEILTQSQKIKENKISAPVSFRITDQNNNPLAFSRFVFLMQSKVPEDFLAALDEDFLVYLLEDQDQIRVALVLNFKETYANPETLLDTAEESFGEAFEGIFYPEDLIFSKDLVFQTGAYEGLPVRYINIDIARNYSLDYILDRGTVVIGNSKESVRKVTEQIFSK